MFQNHSDTVRHWKSLAKIMEADLECDDKSVVRYDVYNAIHIHRRLLGPWQLFVQLAFHTGTEKVQNSSRQRD